MFPDFTRIQVKEIQCAMKARLLGWVDSWSKAESLFFFWCLPYYFVISSHTEARTWHCVLRAGKETNYALQFLAFFLLFLTMFIFIPFITFFLPFISLILCQITPCFFLQNFISILKNWKCISWARKIVIDQKKKCKKRNWSIKCHKGQFKFKAGCLREKDVSKNGRLCQHLFQQRCHAPRQRAHRALRRSSDRYLSFRSTDVRVGKKCPWSRMFAHLPTPWTLKLLFALIFRSVLSIVCCCWRTQPKKCVGSKRENKIRKYRIHRSTHKRRTALINATPDETFQFQCFLVRERNRLATHMPFPIDQRQTGNDKLHQYILFQAYQECLEPPTPPPVRWEDKN